MRQLSTSIKVLLIFIAISALGVTGFTIGYYTISPYLSVFSAGLMGLGLWVLYAYVKTRKTIVAYDDNGNPINIAPATRKNPPPPRPKNFFQIANISNLYLFDLDWEVYEFMKRWFFLLPVAMTCEIASFYVLVHGLYHVQLWIILGVCLVGVVFLSVNEYLEKRKFYYETVLLIIFASVLVTFMWVWWFSPDYVIIPKGTTVYNEYGKKADVQYRGMIANSKTTQDIKVKVVRGGAFRSGDKTWETVLLDEDGAAFGPEVFVIRNKVQEIDEDPDSAEDSGYRTIKFTAGDTTRTDINGDPIIFKPNDSWIIQDQHGSFHLWGDAAPVFGKDPRSTVTGGPLYAIGITDGELRIKVIRAKS